MPRAVLLGLVFLAAILLQGVAAQIPGDTSRAETLQAIGLEKARPLESAARRKTAIVLTGQSVHPATSTNKSIRVIITGLPESHLGVAMAAAIDRRGYFLTAAHVVRDEPLSLVFYDGERLQALPARIVAKLTNTKREGEKKLDIAVLHVNAELDEVFQWADLSKVRRADFLFQIGRAIHERSSTHGIIAPAPFVGKFKKTIKLRNGGTAFRIETPARRGDSGGPVLTLDGKLLGIESGSINPFLGRSYEIANRPDLKWLRDVINTDSPPRREPSAISREQDSGSRLTITVPLLE